MGAIPNRLPGFQDIRDPAIRARIDAMWGITMKPDYGLQHDRDVRGDAREDAQGALRHRREPGAVGGRPASRARSASRGSSILVAQDIFLTKTAQMADVVFPASSSWCESEGTVTNSERRVQRVRKALEPPGDARDDMWIIAQIAKRLGHDWGTPVGREGVGRGARGGAGDVRRHDVRAARGAPRPAVALPRHDEQRRAVPARAPLGRPDDDAARPPSARWRTSRRWRCRTSSIPSS